MKTVKKTTVVTSASGASFSPTVLVAICLLILWSVVPALSLGPSGPLAERRPFSMATTQGDPGEGKQIFRGRCSRCHLVTSTKERLGPGLKGLFQQEKMSGTGLAPTDDNVRKLIMKGSRSMPPFRGVLTEEQVDDLIAYLRTL